MAVKIETVINVQDEVIDLYSHSKEIYNFARLEEMIAYAVGLGIQRIKQEISGKQQFTKENISKEILFRRQAEEILDMSPQAFQKHITKGSIRPFKEYGEGKGKVQLFWKDDIVSFLEKKR